MSFNYTLKILGDNHNLLNVKGKNELIKVFIPDGNTPNEFIPNLKHMIESLDRHAQMHGRFNGQVFGTKLISKLLERYRSATIYACDQELPKYRNYELSLMANENYDVLESDILTCLDIQLQDLNSNEFLHDGNLSLYKPTFSKDSFEFKVFCDEITALEPKLNADGDYDLVIVSPGVASEHLANNNFILVNNIHRLANDDLQYVAQKGLIIAKINNGNLELNQMPESLDLKVSRLKKEDASNEI